jgi:pimeloyl-ACP methyl ester carboxylesterase
MARFLPRDTISAIMLFRPGYLGTPLGDNRTIDRQADLVIALLDALGIGSAGVLSWSGGGPCGYRLAVRYPDRITGLVSVAAVSRADHAPKPRLSDRMMFGTSAGHWLLRVLTAHRPADVGSGSCLGRRRCAFAFTNPNFPATQPVPPGRQPTTPHHPNQSAQ